MLEDFLSYIESNLSVFREDKILLSISGGVDSMVMLHLFRQLDYNIEVAHINHSTRNGQSDDDLALVKAVCNENSIPFHSKTLNYERLLEGNFQENARKERFAFLSELQVKHGFKWIATAHHKDDRWETFLMHLDRKSGLKGLTSLRAIEHHVIHPLLIFTKEDIISFAATQNIQYAHDSSNDSDAYKRNAIRLKVTPEVVRIFPNFIRNANQSILHLESVASLLEELIGQNEFISKKSKSNHLVVDLEKVKSFRNEKVLLYHILEGFGFNYSTICDILKTELTGTQFESENYEGLFDRGVLIMRNKKSYKETNLSIDSFGIYQLATGKRIKIEETQTTDIASHLWIDKTKVKWPLTIRNIQPGDKFKLHGMNGGSKTLKKLFTDLKINRFDKEEILVVCQYDEILQVIGIRSSHNYITSDIKNAITFRITD